MRVVLALAIGLAASLAMAGEKEVCSGKAQEYRLQYPRIGFIHLLSPAGVEIYDDAGSLGTGINGHAYKSRRTGEMLVIYKTTIEIEADRSIPIQIANDRVYWPCP